MPLQVALVETRVWMLADRIHIAPLADGKDVCLDAILRYGSSIFSGISRAVVSQHSEPFVDLQRTQCPYRLAVAFDCHALSDLTSDFLAYIRATGGSNLVDDFGGIHLQDHRLFLYEVGQLNIRTTLAVPTPESSDALARSFDKIAVELANWTTSLRKKYLFDLIEYLERHSFLRLPLRSRWGVPDFLAAPPNNIQISQ